MLTTTPQLTTHRPSPTTISFTVSNSPPHTTLPLKSLHYLTLLLRLTLGLSTLLFVFAKSRSEQLYSVDHDGIISPLEKWFWESEIGGTFARGANTLAWRVVVPLAVGSLGVVVWRFRTGWEESLLTLSSLGIQTSTSSRTYLSSATTRFIPTSLINDIIIYEAFRGFEVRFYLAVVVEGEGEVVVVFPNLLPNRKIVEEVWRGARACLYEPKG